MTAGGPEAAARHADALVGGGRVGDAVGVLTEAVGAHPERPELWGRLAAALLAVRRLPEAWDAAARTVELAPAEPEAHRTIGSVALAMEAWPQAETAFRHVLTLDPDDAGARAALARIPAGRRPTPTPPPPEPVPPTVPPARGRRRAPDIEPTPPSGPLPSGPLPTGPLPTGPFPTGPLPAGPLPAGPLPTGSLGAGRQSGEVPGADRLGGSGRFPTGPPEAPGGRRRAVISGVGGDGLRSGFVRWIRGQWVLGVAAYLGLAYEESAPYMAGAVTLVLVLLGAFGWLRWQGLPAPVKAQVVQVPRADPRARLLVGLALLGVLGVLVVIPASMLGALMAARLAIIGSVAATVAAAVLAGRDRQTATPS